MDNSESTDPKFPPLEDSSMTPLRFFQKEKPLIKQKSVMF